MGKDDLRFSLLGLLLFAMTDCGPRSVGVLTCDGDDGGGWS